MIRSLIIRTGTRDALVTEAVAHLCRAVEAAVATRGVCTLAIPGGSVADALLPRLSEARLPWHAVHLFWCDERAVSREHRDSNAGRAFRLVAQSPLVTLASLHPIRGDAQDLALAAEDYASTLATIAGTPPLLDVAVLGVGEDGHIASLFPSDDALHERDRLVVVVTNAPKAPRARITLTLPVLAQARETLVVAFGSAKAAAVRNALEDPHAVSPLARLVQESRRLLIMLDRPAANQLEHTAMEYIA